MSRRVLASVIGLLCLASLAASAAAQELIQPRVTDRKFPAGVYCPLPFDLAFTANGSVVTLRFSTTTVNYFDNINNQNQWAHQTIDNICISTETAYQAHLGALGGYSSQCYIGPGNQLTQVFYYQEAGTLPLKEEFDVAPSPIQWDITNNAQWDVTGTAPHDPGTDGDFLPLGALGLGLDKPPYDLTDSAYVTCKVEGLTKGTAYRLTGWWYVGNMDLDDIFLTVAILGDRSTTISRKTLGAVKRRYH